MKKKNDWKWEIWGISSSLYSPIPPIVLPCPRVTILRFWPFWALTILKFTILTFFAIMTYSGFWIDLWRSRARVELETRARGLERYKVAQSIGMWVLVQTGSSSWVEICRSRCRDSRLVLKLETSPPIFGVFHPDFVTLAPITWSDSSDPQTEYIFFGGFMDALQYGVSLFNLLPLLW